MRWLILWPSWTAKWCRHYCLGLEAYRFARRWLWCNYRPLSCLVAMVHFVGRYRLRPHGRRVLCCIRCLLHTSCRSWNLSCPVLRVCCGGFDWVWTLFFSGARLMDWCRDCFLHMWWFRSIDLASG